LPEAHKFIGLRNLKFENEKMLGQLNNYGNKEISIPQILYAQYEGNNIIWVGSEYINKGIRPQREKNFAIELRQTSRLFLKAKGKHNQIILNGSKR